jgi:GT2 family glycosyltransferase
MEEKIEVGLIDIIILFYNKVEQTISCINSFIHSGQQIYVLNNGSDVVQLNKLKQTFAKYDQVHILDNGKNLGVSGGRNYLIQISTAPWIFSVDNDIIIRDKDTWVKLFKSFIETRLDIKVVVPKLYNVHDASYSPQLNLVLNEKNLDVVTGFYPVSNCFPGGASIIHRSIFDTYGYFDEAMFVGFEDYEFALRAMLSKQGPFEVHLLEEIELIHHHQFQKTRQDKEAVRQRYNEERMKASYDRIISKYCITFDHDWRWWTNNQLTTMTKSKVLSKFKQKVRNFLFIEK